MTATVADIERTAFFKYVRYDPDTSLGTFQLCCTFYSRCTYCKQESHSFHISLIVWMKGQ